MKVPVSVVVVLVILLTASFLLVLMRYRRYMRKSKNLVLERLDRAIGGNQQQVVYDESLDSAIDERLNQLVDILKTNCARAEEDRNKVKAIISDISHQVRTPLANMMLYAGLLEESNLPEQEHKMAVQIHKQADKLEFYLKELVRSSYLETEMIFVNVDYNSVDDLVENACQTVELAAMRKAITIAYDGCEQSCYFDMRWTVEALANVLDNAIKYSPAGSEVTIAVVSYESFICIQVKDCGIGIAEEEQGLIFSRFYRSDSVIEEKGLGIGLYLTREIIQKQGGYVKVSSRVGEGTIFSLFLLKRQRG